MTQPALFISHGTPMLALDESEGEFPEGESNDEFCRALSRFARGVPRPRAVVVVSAHGLSRFPEVEILASARPKLDYDFSGFPTELYQVEYPCPGEPGLAARIAGLLGEAGFRASLVTESRLDHGAWVPLKIAFPEADIPVVQVSLPFPSDPRRVLLMGKSLAPLRQEGILLLGSGGAVHNLGELVWHEKRGKGAPWAVEFEAWIRESLERRDVEALLSYESEAPAPDKCHPTAEHLFPLFFTVGAALPGDELRLLFEGVQYRSLSMLSFALCQPETRECGSPNPSLH